MKTNSLFSWERSWVINSLIQTVFMANAAEFSELIRTGGLDFALLKPIDTQFLISFPRLTWSQVPNGILGVVLIVQSMSNLMGEKAMPSLRAQHSGICVLRTLRCGGDVQRDDLPGVDKHLVWTKSKSV